MNVEVVSDCRLPEEVQVTFYRVAQEALHNIIKHAHATKVSMGLICDEHHVTLTICDNGRGFENNGTVAKGMGLQIMRERVQRFAVNSALIRRRTPVRRWKLNGRLKTGGVQSMSPNSDPIRVLSVDDHEIMSDEDWFRCLRASIAWPVLVPILLLLGVSEAVTAAFSGVMVVAADLMLIAGAAVAGKEG